MPPGTWLNLAIPGAGLLARGRVGLGLGFILPAMIALSAAVLAQMVVTSTVLGPWRLILVSAYVVLAAAATGLHAVLLRERRLDAEAVRTLHRQVAAAHLADRHAEALAGARRLTEVAAGEPGAWRLLAVMAGAAGDATAATRAQARARRLESEREL